MPERIVEIVSREGKVIQRYKIVDEDQGNCICEVEKSRKGTKMPERIVEIVSREGKVIQRYKTVDEGQGNCICEVEKS